MQIYVDMDGVLADFYGHHQAVFGLYSGERTDDVYWSTVRTMDFYMAVPPMPDFDELWSHIGHDTPIILTGVPKAVPESATFKRAWVDKFIGKQIELRCCPSKDKSLHCRTGDVLIDDWEKYRHLWVEAGGVWITHHNAADTIRRLTELNI